MPTTIPSRARSWSTRPATTVPPSDQAADDRRTDDRGADQAHDTSTTKPSGTTTTKPGGGSPDVGHHADHDPARGDLRQPGRDRGHAGVGRVGQQAQRDRGPQDPARRLRRTVTDAAKYAAAVKTACDQDFAIVGSLAAADDQTTELERCGIPDLPARTSTDEHAQAAQHVRGRPDPGHDPARRWLQVAARPGAEGCCAEYAVLSVRPRPAGSGDAAGRRRQLGRIHARRHDRAHRRRRADRLQPVVQAIIDKKANLALEPPRVPVDGEPPQGRARRRASPASRRGSASTSATRTHFVVQGGAAVNGEYVQIEVNPFEESRSIPAMRSYLKYTKKRRRDSRRSPVRSRSPPECSSSRSPARSSPTAAATA